MFAGDSLLTVVILLARNMAHAAGTQHGTCCWYATFRKKTIKGDHPNGSAAR
jgi:hypothetical protein